MSIVDRITAAMRAVSSPILPPPPMGESAHVSGVLEQLVAEVSALRAELDSLRNGITGTAMRGLDAARGELSPEVVERIAEQVAARCADEVREQVEAILATAEPGEATTSAFPTSHEKSKKEKPASKKAPAPAVEPAPPKKPEGQVATLTARTMDILEADGQAHRASDLRAAIGATEHLWKDVIKKLRVHPCVVIEGATTTRTYRYQKPGAPAPKRKVAEPPPARRNPVGRPRGSVSESVEELVRQALALLELSPRDTRSARAIKTALDIESNLTWGKVSDALRAHPRVEAVDLGDKGTSYKYRPEPKAGA